VEFFDPGEWMIYVKKYDFIVSGQSIYIKYIDCMVCDEWGDRASRGWLPSPPPRMGWGCEPLLPYNPPASALSKFDIGVPLLACPAVPWSYDEVHPAVLAVTLH